MSNLSSAIKSLLRTTFRRPGGLYQPVFVTNVSDPTTFHVEIETLAKDESLPLYSGMLSWEQGDKDGACVVLLEASELGAVSTELASVLPSQAQVVLWSSAENPEVPQAWQSWIDEGIIQPLSNVEARPRKAAALSTIEMCLSQRVPAYNPVTLLADQEEHERLALETVLRFEKEGVVPVAAVDVDGVVDSSARSLIAGAKGVLLRISSYQAGHPENAALLRSVSKVVEVGTPVVIVATPRGVKEMEATSTWASVLERGLLLNLVREVPVSIKTATDSSEWPPLVDVLAGEPARGPVANIVFEGALNNVNLGDVLQMVGLGRHTGRLVIFSTDQYGYIDFRRGSIVYAGPEGRWPRVEDVARVRGVDLKDDDTRRHLVEESIQERICEMANWFSPRFVFSSRSQSSSEESVRLSPQSVALEIARRSDEILRLSHRIGDMGRVWRRDDDIGPPEGAGAYTHALWRELDGKSTLHDLAQKLGLTYYQALEAMEPLVGGNLVYLVQEGTFVDEGVGTVDVVRQLWDEGLFHDADDVMRKSMDDAMEPELSFYFAWSMVRNDNIPAALEAFDLAQRSSMNTTRLYAYINAVILRIRRGTMSAVDAFRVLSTNALWQMGHTPSPKGLPEIAPALAEISVRAGEIAAAKQFLSTVEDPGIRRCVERIVARAGKT